MRWLLVIGALLVILGVGGEIRACAGNPYVASGSTTPARPEANSAPTEQERAGGGDMVLAIVSGLAFAVGIVCLVVGMGQWNRPTPSSSRPANPWNEQPADKGDPPVGLV